MALPLPIIVNPGVTPAPVVAGVGKKINCLQAVYFHPVKTEKDFFNPQVSFSPLFVHHFFGLREEIYGFSELLVRIFYTVDTFDVFVKVEAVRADTTTAATLVSQPTPISSYSEASSSVQSNNGGGFSSNPDEEASFRILSYLSRIPYPGDFCRSESAFIQAIQSESRKKFHPRGHLVAHLTGVQGVKLRLYQCRFDDTVAFGQEFSTYHRRIEWFLHFFIDACSNIDHDRRWTVLLPFIHTEDQQEETTSAAAAVKVEVKEEEKQTGKATKRNHNAITTGSSSRKRPKLSLKSTTQVAPTSSSWSGFELVGIVTLYHFYALPTCRRRISQFLVFPHYQGRNLGLQLCEWVFNQAIADPEIGEISIEDPASSFVQLRDVVCLRLALGKGVIRREDLFPDGEYPPLLQRTSSSSAGRVSTPVRRGTAEGGKTTGAPANKKQKKDSIHEVLRSPQDPNSNKENISIAAGDTAFRAKLKAALKESPNQIVRLVEIMAMAKVLPHPLPPLPAVSSSSNSTTTTTAVTPSSSSSHIAANQQVVATQPSGNKVKEIVNRDWRAMMMSPNKKGKRGGGKGTATTTATQQNVNNHQPATCDESDFHVSEATKELRVKIKKRIRLDHIEEFGTLSPSEQRVNLADRWNDIYVSYYRTVKKVRTAILMDDL